MREWDVKSFEWPLDRDSVVVEVGGFKGRWCAEIARRYDPSLIVFEPQPWAADACVQALEEAGSTQYQVMRYALGLEDERRVLGAFGTDGASLLRDADYMLTYEGSRNKMEQVEVVETVSAFRELGLDRIDVLMMNIEGWEYRLLYYMLANDLIRRIRFLVVQFHLWAEGRDEYEQLCRLLGDTHDVHWSYGRSLRAWKRWGDD